MPNNQQSSMPDHLKALSRSYGQLLILEAALHNGVFDALDKGSFTVEETAERTGNSTRGLRALMNALVAMGYLSKNSSHYTLTSESARYLVRGKPKFMGGKFRRIRAQLLPRWLELTEVVRTGRPKRPVNREKYGAEFFQEFVGELFHEHYPAACALADALAIGALEEPIKVLDVGAGSGVWSIAMAKKSPYVSVTAVDWDTVLTVAKQQAESEKVIDRYCFLGGDIESVNFGSGYQIAVLGYIIHGLGENRSRQLLLRVCDAMASGGTVIIADNLPNEERTGPENHLIFAVNMLALTEEGDAFTFAEIRDWLTDSGFTNLRCIEVGVTSPLILASKPQTE